MYTKELTDEQLAAFDAAYDEAYIAACESDSPNSPDFQAILAHECEKRGVDPEGR